MPIEPDTKDWTWVLERRCEACGFAASGLAPDAIAGAVHANARAWVAVLAEPAEQLRRRPSDDRWSPLEYACHVRDVCRVFDGRLALMLATERPAFADWDQDRTALEDRYREQDPATVAVELAAAAEALATRFAGVDPGQWDRAGDRSDGARFTVASLGRYLVHDPVHHLHEVRRDLRDLPAQP